MELLYVLLLVAVAVALFFIFKGKNREPFKVLGTLSNQSDTYYACLSACERDDPNKSLNPTKGSAVCLDYCDRMTTDRSSRPGTAPGETAWVPVPTVEDNARWECQKFAGPGVDPSQYEECLENYTTRQAIEEKCIQECKYGVDGGGPFGVISREAVVDVTPNPYGDAMLYGIGCEVSSPTGGHPPGKEMTADRCIAQCKKSYSANYSLGWSWK